MESCAWRKFSFFIMGLVVWGMSLLLSVPAKAQVAGATLAGTVTDASNAAVPQAKIAIRNTATGITASVETNADGFYTATNLIPGPYEVVASATGFASVQQAGLVLTVGARQQLNFSLKVGEVSQVVEVTGAAPIVELTSSSISAEVSGVTVRELPLNGRSWTDLVSLQPGVNALNTQMSLDSGGGGQTRANRGFGNEVSIAGARPNQSNFRLDGISMNDYANAGPGSVMGGNLGVDAIAEFSVISTNYSAEYGKTAGGVVNAISRSGTNQFHGSVYEFMRNSALDARNFFDGPKIPPFRRNQFGGSASLPIIKDRTLIFGDYEGIRQFKGISQLSFVPSAAARAGNLCSTPSSSGCVPHTVIVDPAAAKYIPLYPLPNAGVVSGSNGDQGRLLNTTNNIASENFFTIRADHKISDKDSLFGSYMFDRTPYFIPDVFNSIVNKQFTFRQLYTVEETHTFSNTFVNTVRVGYNRMRMGSNFGDHAVNPLAADPSLGIRPGINAGALTIGGGIRGYPGGLGVSINTYDYWNSYQLYNDASWTRGKHSIRFGGSVENMRLNHTVVSSQGTFTFPSFEAFLTNSPSRFAAPMKGYLGAPIPGDNDRLAWRQTLFGLYIQDDWRARPNLTVNLGLRYEPMTVLAENQGHTSVIHNITDPTFVQGRTFQGNANLRNFQPRIGFAWDPFGNGKTSIRSGFGLFDSLNMAYLWNARQAVTWPQSGNGTISSASALKGKFYTGAISLLQPSSLGIISAILADQQPPRSYTMQWNLSVQRQITSSLTTTIGYIGSSGVHLPITEDTVNTVVPRLIEGRYVYPNPIGSGTKINPNFASITGDLFVGKSNYHALITSLTKKLSHGLMFQTSFTWSKNIDIGSTSSFGDTFANAIGALDWFDLQNLTRGPTDFNQSKNLQISAMYDIPSIKSLSGFAGRVVNGWRVGTIISISDGQPFSATFGVQNDVVGNKSNTPYSFPDRLTGSGCETLVNPGNPDNYIKKECFALPTAPSLAFWNANCDHTSLVFGSAKTTIPFPYCFNMRGNAGRNIMSGPGIRQASLSVYKDNFVKGISETANLQFRAEFFNVTNHPNFSPPLTAVFQSDIFNSNGTTSSSGGVLASTVTTSREIQFALKLIW
jgi:hypothetical protein